MVGGLVVTGLFPAYAGVIPLGTDPDYPDAAFPRLRGGDPGGDP